MNIEEMELFEAECKLLCYKGNMSRSNLGSFYNNEQTNWMYQMWLSSKNREGYKLVPVDSLKEIIDCAYCHIDDRCIGDEGDNVIKHILAMGVEDDH